MPASSLEREPLSASSAMIVSFGAGLVLVMFSSLESDEFSMALS
jgi:hypothetical protein